jgi:Pregnancy-associated plasma protein-A/Secretion system C-terminal sorting domain
MRRFFLCLPAILFACALNAQRNCYHTAYQKNLSYSSSQPRYTGAPSFTNLNRQEARSGANDHGVKAYEASPLISIPVVVHILWNNKAENISDAQVNAQLASLNKDFSATNADIIQVPAYFKHLIADANIQFVLARKDELGLPTTGIIRKWTAVTGFGFNDQAKYPESGGSSAWNPEHYLNIWVCSLQDGVQGYATLPGSPTAIDGVVIDNSVFGLQPSGPFKKGRTATHEIGHWLGLQHIWGDGACGSDEVDDTPPQQGPTRGCPVGVRLSCGATTTGDMYMNFMDFTDDACMHLFTRGQCMRMRALFEPGGPRNALLFSTALDGPLIAEPQLPAPEKISAQLYPNPAVHSLTIQTNGVSSFVEQPYRIINVTGQVVSSGIIQSAQQKIMIHSLPAGLYFIQINDAKPLKFIKQPQ